MAVDLGELPLPDELPAIPVGWRYELLGDLVEERGVSYGIVQPGSEAADGVPIVRVNNIRNGRIDTTDMLQVAADIEAKFLRSRLRGGEVLLTLVGTLGEVAIVPQNLRGWNVARAVGVIPVRNDPGSLWVSICFRSAFIQHCIRTWATTTVQATFNLRDSPDKLRAMGARARAAFEREWNEPIALARWREVLAGVESCQYFQTSVGVHPDDVDLALDDLIDPVGPVALLEDRCPGREPA